MKDPTNGVIGAGGAGATELLEDATLRDRAAGEVLAGGAGPIERAIAIMDLLRSPEGCPWDREQTFDSIKRHTLEETYEVFDAIERRSWTELKDELGDLLLQVLFYAQMAEEAGYFDIRDVAANLTRSWCVGIRISLRGWRRRMRTRCCGTGSEIKREEKGGQG